MSPQHIIGLQISNVKRISAVNIRLDKAAGAVVLSGSNSAGKSSVMDAIAMAILGKNAVPEKPIRTGQEKASVMLETEDLIVKRCFTEADTYISVTNKEGLKYSKPQEILDKLISVIGFDPLHFSQMPQKDQAKELLRICPTSLDLDDNARRAKSAEDDRRDANRDLKKLEAQLAGMPEVGANVPDQEVSIADLTQALSNVRDEAQKFSVFEGKVSDAQDQVVDIDSELESCRKRISELEAHKAELKGKIEKAQERLKTKPNFAEKAKELQDQISGAEQQNARIRQKIQRKRTQNEVDQARTVADRLDKKLEEIRAERKNALEKASFPVPGLSIDPNGVVTFKGNPLSQCSTSEQIKVGVALAASGNPTLRVIFIKDGSLLDKASMQALEKLAEENDLQIWMERVEDSSPAAIQIVDGTNVAAPVEEAMAK